MERPVPKILYIPTPSHTRKVFRPEHYARLETYFDFQANPEEKNPNSEQLATQIGGFECLITGWGAPRITPAVIEAADSLKLIAHSAGSVRGMLNEVVDALRQRSITVFSANRAIAYNVAEATVGYMIMTSRRWYDHMTVTRNGGWGGRVPNNGQYLRGSIVGLVSASTVGREVIRLLEPFGVRILLYDPYLSDYDAGRLGIEKVANLDDLFKTADFVSVHAPSVPETNKMVGRQQLSLMRDGAVFINCSRGSVLDHDALTEVAAQGNIQVVLDVTTPEPLPADHPLRSLPNVYLTPHVTGAGFFGYFQIGELTMLAVENFFAGKPFDGKVNLDVWERLA